jgi:hypothetical protein
MDGGEETSCGQTGRSFIRAHERPAGLAGIPHVTDATHDTPNRSTSLHRELFIRLAHALDERPPVPIIPTSGLSAAASDWPDRSPYIGLVSDRRMGKLPSSQTSLRKSVT